MRPLPRPVPRWRPRFRRPTPTTMLAIVAAVVTFMFVQTVAGSSGRDRTRWGPPATALVSVDELEPGQLVGPDDLESIEVPGNLVPADATTADPVGRTVRTRIGTGEIVVEHRLAGSDTQGTAALLEPDQRGVAVPRSGIDLDLVVGDQVDVLATLTPTTESGDPTILLVERATVIATGEETVTLAVGREQATTLTHALVTATVTLTLVA